MAGKLHLALAAGWLVFAAPIVALVAPPAHAGDRYAPIRNDINAEIAAGRLTGVAVALVHDGEIVWEQGFGWADRAASRQATAHTPFSIASTTKPFTTTALMTLVADGRIELERPANDYLGREKIIGRDGSPATELTVRHLATHSSGLPTFFEMYPEGEAAQPPPIPELIADYGHAMAPPGERYEYSNLAMAILAGIVARSAQREFGRYLHERIFEPLGMHDSFLDSDRSRRAQMAVRYDDGGAPLPFYLTATPGSGAIYASAHDLARFAMLYLKDDLGGQAKILDDARLDELHRPATTVAPGHYYAMGWQVLRRPGRPEVLYHGGGQAGVETEFVLVPEHDLACIVLSNRGDDGRFLQSLRDQMLRTALPDWNGIPRAPTPPLQPLQPIAGYAGQWRGTLLAQGEPVPVMLDISVAGEGRLSLDGREPQPITGFGLVDGQLTGDTHGRIDSPDSRRERLQQLQLNLKLRGDRIDGEIVAWRLQPDDMTILPYWVDLRRVDTPPR